MVSPARTTSSERSASHSADSSSSNGVPWAIASVDAFATLPRQASSFKACRVRNGERLSLPFAVQRQARDTARAAGLTDRGTLSAGQKADLNIIDIDGLHVRRPETHFDLPAGGKRLLQRVDGYRHTVVSGVETYRDGQPTGELPGRLRRSRVRPPAEAA